MEIVQPLILYITVTFMATEAIKAMFKAGKIKLGKRSIWVAGVIAFSLSIGWNLSVLPEPQNPIFTWISVTVTALVIAGTAGGVYEWLRSLIPGFDAAQQVNDDGE